MCQKWGYFVYMCVWVRTLLLWHIVYVLAALSPHSQHNTTCTQCCGAPEVEHHTALYFIAPADWNSSVSQHAQQYFPLDCPYAYSHDCSLTWYRGGKDIPVDRVTGGKCRLKRGLAWQLVISSLSSRYPLLIRLLSARFTCGCLGSLDTTSRGTCHLPATIQMAR